MANYELIDETNGLRYRYLGCRIGFMICLCVITSILVFRAWQHIYEPYHEDLIKYPKFHHSIPPEVVRRAHFYSFKNSESHDFRLVKNSTFRIKYLHDSDVPPRNLNVRAPKPQNETLMVCYYTHPSGNKSYDDLNLTNIDGSLCTHVNIGIATIKYGTVNISSQLERSIEQLPELRKRYPKLKFLIWIGGGGLSSEGFSEMTRDHNNRKHFIASLLIFLKKYGLDGCDLDWEFPTAYNRERTHFSQLLYEIRKEFTNSRKRYILSVAVAAPEGIALFSYDVAEINKYADIVNLMSYDYHFFTKTTPFTGFNAPLYARPSEHSLLATLNINYSVHWWLANGLDRKKMAVGLATYGHSFTLVNPFNTGIGAPANDYGYLGNEGFISVAETCWFLRHNIVNTLEYDTDACSSYASAGTEWISFEHAESIACKAHYIKSMGLGGAMIFSLNTDDFNGICDREGKHNRFPLLKTIHSILK